MIYKYLIFIVFSFMLSFSVLGNECTTNLPAVAFSDNFSSVNNEWKVQNFNRSISNWPNDSILNSNNEAQVLEFLIANNRLSIMGPVNNVGDNEYGMVYFDHADAGDTSIVNNYAIFYDVTANKSNINNDLGIVFGYQSDSNYYVARWTKYGSSYINNNSFPGDYRKLEVIKVSSGTATSLVQQNNFDVSDPFNLGVVVNNNGIFVCVNDTVLLQENSEQPALHTHGFLSYDNDIGISVDNFEVRYVPVEDNSVPEPIAVYSFEQTSFDAGINDSSGNNFTGNNIGGVPTFNGKFCSAFDSNGNNESVNTDNAFSTGVDLDDDVGTVGTITFWYKSNTPWNEGGYNGTGERILFDASLDIPSGSDKYFQLEIENDGRLLFSFEDTADADRDIGESSGSTRLADTWYYITATWNLNTNFFEIYVDGTRVVANNQSTNGAFKDLGPIIFGDNTSAYSQNGHINLPSRTSANGFFDEIQIYDEVLSESDIQRLMSVEPLTCVEELGVNQYCETTFVDGITSHTNSGQIIFNNRVTLFDNNDDTLAAASFNTTTHQNGGVSLTCDGFGFCTPSGSPTQAISDVGNFLTTNSNTNFTVGNNGLTCTIGEASSDDCNDQTGNQFNEIRVNNDGTLFFSNMHDQYRINTLLVNDRGKVYLPPGDYWINRADFNNDTQIIVNGTGVVNIYINDGASRFTDRATINENGDSNSVFIYAYNDIRFNNDTKINGFIYSEQQVTLGARVVLTGAVSADVVSINDDSEIYYTCPFVQPSVDHYEILHDSNGLTCEPETITIQACTNSAGNTCDLATTPVTVDLLVNGSSQNVTNSAVTFTGSTTTSFSYTDAESVTLSLSDVSVAATNSLVCKNGGTVSNCQVVFADVGFVFDSNTINNQVSGVEFDGIAVQALENNQGVCQAVFNGDVNVGLAMEYVAPKQVTNNQYQINGSGIQTSIQAPSSYSTVTLNFDNESKAIINNNHYFDAGQIRLHINYTDSNGVVYNGTSNHFWVRPANFVLSAFAGDVNNPSLLNNSAASGGTSHHAGERFNFSIQAVNDRGDVTTNYRHNNLQIAATRMLPLPPSGNDGRFYYTANGSSGPFITSNSTFSTTSNVSFAESGEEGTFQSDAAEYSEVGVISIQAQDLSYGGVNKFNISSAAITVGRFTPANFVLTSASIAAACDGFTYMDEEALTVMYEIEARNDDNLLTQNYFGDFTANTTVSLVAENANDGIDLSARLTNFEPTVWSAGRYLNTDTLGVFARRTDSIPDGAFGDLMVGIQVTDLDNTVLMGLNMLATGQGDCSAMSSCDALSIGTTQVRYGRVFLNNAYGPETFNLAMPMQTQYLNNDQYVINTDDNCTTLATDNNEVNITQPAGQPNFTGAVSNTNVIAGAGEIDVIELTAPNSLGSVDVQMQVPAWLTFDWNNDNDFSDFPFATATFGLYRGNDRIIQWREVNP